jgi:AcrR family transcriptional regulator
MASTISSYPAEQRQRGRPLDPARHEAIMRAALEGLADVGYDRLSMEQIAARAQVGKGALYRRWSSKAELVVDAMLRWREQWAPVSLRDTGSLLGDLDAMIAQVPDIDEAAQRQLAVLLGLLSAATRDPELRQALADSGFARPRQAILDVLSRAASRGELAPQLDLDLVPDVLIGLNLLRMVLGQPPDRAYVERVLRNIIYPLVAADRDGRQHDGRSG